MSDESATDTESALSYDSDEVVWDGLESSSDTEEGEIVVMEEKSSAMIRELMRKVLKVVKLLQPEKEKVEGGMLSAEELQRSDNRLQEIVSRLQFLFGRLTFILFSELTKSTDKLNNSLNIHDAMEYENLCHVMFHNMHFCQSMADIIETVTEGRPYPEEQLSDAQREVLKKYYVEVGKLNISAAMCAYLLVIGTREHFVEPPIPAELCETVIQEKIGYKRIVHLAVLCCGVLRDDQALYEAQAFGVPKFLFGRLRSLVHSIFGQFSRITFADGTPFEQDGSRSEQSGSNIDSPVPSRESTFRNSPRKRERSRNRSPVAKAFRLEQTDELCLDQWYPQRGDKVARGPCWNHGSQGENCDFGEVVGVTDADEVVVKWIKNIESQTGEDEVETLFRYKYKSPDFEVCLYKHFLMAKTMHIRPLDIKIVELGLVLDTIGHICQSDAAQHANQHSAVEWLLHILDSIVLVDDRQAYLNAREKVNQREKGRFAHANLNENELNELVDNTALWDADLCRKKRVFENSQSLIFSTVYALSTLVTHKKIGLKFAALNGPNRIIHLVKTFNTPQSNNRCAFLLANLCGEVVFEKILREHKYLAGEILSFSCTTWDSEQHVSIKESAVRLLSALISFPCMIRDFDLKGYHIFAVKEWNNLLAKSEQAFDIVDGALQEQVIKLLKFYVVTHLILATKVAFVTHPKLSFLTKLDENTSLFKEPAVTDAVLGFLVCSSRISPDISPENILSLLTPDNLVSIKALVDAGVHTVLSRSANFYYLQGRFGLLNTTLKLEAVLTVAPFIRPLVIQSESFDSILVQLVNYVGDLSSLFIKSKYSKESQALLCATSSLRVLLHVTTPPVYEEDEAAVSMFNTICRAFRDCGGIKTLLDIIKVRLDSAMSVKLMYFPLVTRAVQLLVTLRRYGDTEQLFEALGVHRIVQDLLTVYGDVQKEHISVMRERRLYIELDPASHFVENVQSFATESLQTQPNRASTIDRLETEEKNLIINRAVVDYSKKSLLQLIQQYLKSEGLRETASTLGKEVGLTKQVPLENASGDTPTLDALVRTYLRQQQGKSPIIIETLPQFDLTKRHVYVPPPPPADETKSVLNRLLLRKNGYGNTT